MGYQKKIRTDKDTQITSNFFAAVCKTLFTNKPTTSEYHSQSNGQVKRFNCNIITRPRRYVADHHTDWDTFILPSTHSCNFHVYRPTKVLPFSYALLQTPPQRFKVTPKWNWFTLGQNTTSQKHAQLQIIKRAVLLCEGADMIFCAAQPRYKRTIRRRLGLF